MASKYLQNLDLTGDYAELEGQPNSSNKFIINSYKQLIDTTQLDINGNSKAWTIDKKLNVNILLSQIEDIAKKNRNEAQKQYNQLGDSENIIKKEIIDLKENDNVLKDLQKEKIDVGIQNICNSEYSEFYDQITELNYKLALITQQKNKIKSNLIKYDNDIISIQNYKKAIT
jgi:flagellar biosynthesis chaperone FliJ